MPADSPMGPWPCCPCIWEEQAEDSSQSCPQRESLQGGFGVAVASTTHRWTPFTFWSTGCPWRKATTQESHSVTTGPHSEGGQLTLTARSCCNPENPRISEVKNLRKHLVVDIGLTKEHSLYFWVFNLY